MTQKETLPAPRLQLRWAKNNDRTGSYADCSWACHYELVLPLREGDIRRDQYDEAGEVVGEISELVVPIKGPTGRQSAGTPTVAPDGSRYYDTPFRDGAHAKFDAEVLGNPPIYVIGPDGVAFLEPTRGGA